MNPNPTHLDSKEANTVPLHTPKKIPVKVYSEIKGQDALNMITNWDQENILAAFKYSMPPAPKLLEWVDNKGTNTPYIVTVVNK